MKANPLLVLLCLLNLFANGQEAQKTIPHLVYNNGYAQLLSMAGRFSCEPGN